MLKSTDKQARFLLPSDVRARVLINWYLILEPSKTGRTVIKTGRPADEA